MRAFACIAVLCLVGSWPVFGQTARGGANALPEPVFTNQTAFRIPFRYDPAELARIGAKEIRLFVSVDRGQTWQHVQSVAPTTRHFEYRVLSDGEYWFAVRTLDARNRLLPFGQPMRPGLRVIVDTHPPELHLRIAQERPGRVEMSWEAADEHLDVGSLRLEYIQPGIEAWRPLKVTPAARGRAVWNVPAGGPVAVRGSIADRAGNVARDQVQLDLPEPNGPSFSSDDEPVATTQPAPYRRSQPVEAALTARPPAALAGAVPAHRAASPDPGSAGNDATTGLPPTARTAPAQPHDPNPNAPARSAASSGRVPLWGESPSASPRKPLRFRAVNTREFDIAYRIEDVGPSGVGKVELFITQDNGRKWWKYGEDPDLRSPFNVRVPADGVYGFAIRVSSGVGIADPPPQPGEPPELVIVVDQTPPLVQLLPIRQGTQEGTNTLIIQWRAADDHFDDHPIALSFAPSPQGPWQPVTGWLPNTGRYVWAVPNNVPAQLYLRITARDIAGNLSSVVSGQPVIVDLSKPTARIVDVAPPPRTRPQ
ncbi:MAG: hypothetical protein D6725_12660 [Planctomycetota bacterium]|nr:MAG: hypothetical protein D6725_12660 [Planctomycetota bacterium]